MVIFFSEYSLLEQSGFPRNVVYGRADKTLLEFQSDDEPDILKSFSLSNILQKRVHLPKKPALNLDNQASTSTFENAGPSQPVVSVCPFCKEIIDPLETANVLTERGLQTIMNAREIRKDNKLQCSVGDKYIHLAERNT